MDLELWKKTKKEKKLTIADIAKLANLPKGSVQNIFCGYVPNPRTDTVEAIEKALGLDKSEDIAISAEDRELIELIKQLSDEETKELSNFVDFIIAKRK